MNLVFDGSAATTTLADDEGILFAPAGSGLGTTLTCTRGRINYIKVYAPAAYHLHVKVYDIATVTVSGTPSIAVTGGIRTVVTALSVVTDTLVASGILMDMDAANAQDSGGGAITATTFIPSDAYCQHGMAVWLVNESGTTTGAMANVSVVINYTNNIY